MRGFGAGCVAAFVVLTVFMSDVRAAKGAETSGDLQAVLDQLTAEHLLVPGASAAVDGPQGSLPWRGASGSFALGSATPLNPDDPYRIASVTKMFTAAAILRLVEDRRLALDDTIQRWLPAETVDRISVIDGTSYGAQITVRQLLNHTSGIYSHDEDPQFTVQVATQPRKVWTAQEQIDMAVRNGAHFKPGEGWRYSDTGYVLLGQILQRVTAGSLGAAYRDLLDLQRLGLTATHHELLEPAPPDGRARAHQYVAFMDFDGHDPSFDSWGGGGLVSTNDDVTRFMRHLFDGRVFRRATTLRSMLTAVPTGSAVMTHYGLGIGRRQFDGTTCWGHSGFWSSLAYYCPELDLAFAGTTNQNKDEHGHQTHGQLGEAIVRAVKRLEAPVRGIGLSVRPRRLRAGRRAILTVTATGTVPIPGVRVSLLGRTAHTDADGRARMLVRPRRDGTLRVEACKSWYRCGTARLRVRARESA